MPTLFRRRTAGHPVALSALLLLTASCTPDSTSVAMAAEPGAEAEPIVTTVFTDEVELFMEHPQLVAGQAARFLAHVTVLATGEPVRSGQLRLELFAGPGTPRVFEAARPTRDGLFIPEGTFDTPGQYAARIVVTSDQVQASIPIDPLVVHANAQTARAASEAAATEQPKDSLPFLLEQQWKIGMRMQVVERRSLTKRLLLPGEVVPPHHAMAEVSAPLAGRLLPPDSGRLPRMGERVEAGAVLGQLAPPLTVSDAAQLAANETFHDTIDLELLVRGYDLEARGLEVELLQHQSKARVEFAHKALERIEGLREKDLGTLAELEAARRDMELAKRESAAAALLEQSLARSKQELETLHLRTESSRSATLSHEQAPLALLAPIAGEIVTVEHVLGESVESQGLVFRILDLSHVWITAHASEFDLALIGTAPNALLRLAAFPERTFDVIDDLGGRLQHIGRFIDPETRTLPLRFEVPNPEGLFRAGMFVDVLLETEQALDAIAVPKQAIVMVNGRPTAFRLIHGELFQKRTLELGIHDGAFVEVRSGLDEGDRVVTSGAYLVKLASASPASFGEGHAH